MKLVMQTMNDVDSLETAGEDAVKGRERERERKGEEESIAIG